VLSVLIFWEILAFSTSMTLFLTGWACIISKNLIPIFFLLDLCPRIKLSKKIQKTKGKNRSNLTGEKKTKKKIKRYLLLKCKTIKTLYLNKRKQIKEEGPNPYTLVKKIPFFYSLIFPPLRFGAATTHL